MGCDYVGTPKLSGVLGVFGFPSLVSVPLRRWDQLSQLTGHNLHPTYLRVTSNVTEKYEKYLWYWYPMTQLSSQSCLQHQESIPQHLFLTGVLWADLKNVRGWRVLLAGDIDQNPQLPGDIDQNSHNCQAILTNFV